jgi:hypothetical protein
VPIVVAVVHDQRVVIERELAEEQDRRAVGEMLGRQIECRVVEVEADTDVRVELAEQRDVLGTRLVGVRVRAGRDEGGDLDTFPADLRDEVRDRRDGGDDPEDRLGSGLDRLVHLALVGVVPLEIDVRRRPVGPRPLVCPVPRAAAARERDHDPEAQEEHHHGTLHVGPPRPD